MSRGDSTGCWRAYLRAHERITHCEYPDETNGDLLSGAHPLLFLLDQVVVVIIIEVDNLDKIWSLKQFPLVAKNIDLP